MGRKMSLTAIYHLWVRRQGRVCKSNFKMALSLWNTTDNVITWFNRLALSKGDFKIQTGAGNYNFEVNKLYRSLSHHYVTYSTFNFAPLYVRDIHRKMTATPDIKYR